MADQTILLIEYNPDDVLLTRRTLKKNNICSDVMVVRDGAEALDYLFGSGRYEGQDLDAMPQVILLDLTLPKVDGLEVLRRIRSEERTKLLPTVILTCSEDQERLLASYGLGANSYMRKPVDVEQFRQVVRKLGMYWMGLDETPQ